MKYFLFIISLLSLGAWGPQRAAAQAPAWNSARAVAEATAAAARNHSEVTATAVDAAGNVFLAGNFRMTVTLGSTKLTSLGSNNVFVAKFNPVSKQFVWAVRAGGTGSDDATALAVHGTSVYVAGVFESGPADFGPAKLTSSGSFDVFVAKLTDAGRTGSFVWAQRAGGKERDAASALAVHGTSVYVAGRFDSFEADFGPSILTGEDGFDVFVAKLTDAGRTGSFVWAQRAGGEGNDQAKALAVSGNNVYVAGFFESPTAEFGPVTLDNTGTANAFVAKLTDAGRTGSFTWAQRAGGIEGNDQANALAVRGTSVYVAGTFSSAKVGFGTDTLTNAGDYDMFVAKLTDAGGTSSFGWAQRAGGIDYDQANALAVRGTSVYVAGNFYSPTAEFGAATLTNAGVGSNVFVAKLTDTGSTGRMRWAQRAGCRGGESATALALSGTSVYVAGSLGSPTASFGTTTLTNPTPNASLGYLASLPDPTLAATTAAKTR